MIREFLEMGPERVETFIDDAGIIYFVNKGDLDTYFLREGESIEPEPLDAKHQNEFLEDMSFDFF